jgi:Lamin Tail Domain
MIQADDSSDLESEWIELYNKGNGPTNLMGWKVQTRFKTFVITTKVIIPLGGYVVLSNRLNSQFNLGYKADFYFTGMTLNDISDIVQLIAPGNILHDVVEWDNSWSIPFANSIGLIDSTLDNSKYVNWCRESPKYNMDHKGTPGKVNSCEAPSAMPSVAPSISRAPSSKPSRKPSSLPSMSPSRHPIVMVINEIMISPNGSSFAAMDWFEVYNAGLSTQNMRGWMIKDNELNWTVDIDLFVPPQQYAIFAGNSFPANITVGFNTSFVVQDLALANIDDVLILISPDNVVRDIVDWDSTWGRRVAGASIALKNPALNNNLFSSWCNETVWYTSDHRGTPGKPTKCT